MASADVAIVGGGIVGLSVARLLRRRGAAVSVVEASRTGQEATGAAAGILSLLAESLHPAAGAVAAVWPLAEAALRAYPDYVAALREESGVDPELDARGFLMVAFGPSEEEALSDALVRAARLGLRVAKIAGDEARRLEPLLATAVATGLLAPSDAQVDPRLLARALAASCRGAGVAIREGVRVRGVRRSGGALDLALDGGGTLSASKVVVASGAWAAELSVPPLRSTDIVPCRGQMLVFKKDGVAPAGPLLYRAGHGYLVTRRDGRVLAGSTMEPGATDKVVTAQGIGTLARNAVALLPALADAPLVDSWAGLRPQAKDHAPVIGESDEAGVFFAAGLFKSGILLAPAVADAVAELVEGRSPAIDLGPVAPARFRAAASQA